MKLMKRATALLLCFLMLTNGPINAFATEGVSDNDVVVTEVCEECGGSDAHTDTCSLNPINLLNNDTPVVCTVCGAENCETTHVYCDTCEKYDCGLTHTTCDKCGTVDCQSTHEAWRDTCKKDSCGVDHTTPADNNGETVGGNDVGCNECKQLEGHLDTCSQYKAPVTKCEHCGIELTEGAVHLDTCLTLCTCEPVEGVHQEGCKLYVEPVEEIAEDNGLQVGDKIWIKSGSMVYKNMDDNQGHKLILNYNVTIESIEYNEEGEAIWYRFSPAVMWLGKYEYVHVENTSEEEPDKVTHDGSVTVTTEDGNSMQVDGIPENAALQVSAAKISDMENISDFILQQTGSSGAVEELFAYDITIVDENGEEWQPGDEPVTVTLTIPDLTLGFYQQLQVAHMHDGEIKTVENVEMDLEKETISFTTDGFSTFVGSFVDFSSDVKNSIMLTPGTAEPLVDILEAIAPETYLKYTVPDDVESVTVSSGTTGITATKSSVTAAEDFEYDEATLTVKMKKVDGIDATTYTIRVLRGDPIFGLKGAHDNWNSDGHAEEAITISGENLGTYDVFDKVVYSNDAENCNYAKDGNDAAFGGNYRVYLRPGMAFTFSDRIFLKNPSTNEVMEGWSLDDYKDSKYDFGGWKWIYNSSTYKNYLIAQKVDKYTVCRIQIRDADAASTAVRYIELHIIPDNTPELLRDWLADPENQEAGEGYSIKEVPATLFDYDGYEWNKYYSGKYSDQKFFAFTSEDGGKAADSSLYGYQDVADQANTGSGNANQGLVMPKLVNGLPVMAQANKVDLFSTDEINGTDGQPKAKEVYENVGFEFIYDSDGYYTYNSELNHAQFNNGTNKIELYTQSLSPSDSNTIGQNWADQNPKAGFYPFANINEAFHSIDATGKSVEEKLALLKQGVDRDNRLNGDLAKDFVTTRTAGSTVAMYFGVHLHSDFYLPEGKMLNGKEMKYEFTGDDDLWVFIDGQLVLDVGGGHTPISGSFNLTTGDVWVEKFYQLNATAGGYYTEQKGFTGGDTYRIMLKDENGKEYDFLNTLADDQMHTIDIFYLERFSGESNCRMRFNLPLVPSDAVNVSKNLVNQDGEELSVTPDVDYTFMLYTAEGDASGNDDEVNATNFSVKANAPYTVMGTGAPTDTQYTDSNGKFTLKAGWTATFPGIDRFTEVKVVELEQNDGYKYAGHTISVNGGTATDYTPGKDSETKVMQLNQSIRFDFVNKMQTQPLTIEKQVVNGANGLINPEQKFQFTLDFTKAILETGTGAIAASDKSNTAVALTDGGIFELGHAESVTIPRVPVNMTFTLMETNPDTNNSFDAPIFAAETCTSTEEPVPNAYAFGMAYPWKINNGATNKIVVTNQQRFNLTITKDGISEIDHDSDEQQSTIYTIVGKIGNTVLVEMDVAICGNDSVIICKLPVGSYTVEENTDWSWRYDPDGGATGNVKICNDANASVIYKNDRTKQCWLSGDCYVENWWGENNGNVIRKDKDE